VRADRARFRPESENRAKPVPVSGLPWPWSRFFCSRVRFFNLLVQDRALGVEEEVCPESSAHEASWSGPEE